MIGYPQRLTEHVAKEAAKSEIVKDQLKIQPNVFLLENRSDDRREERTGCEQSVYGRRGCIRKHLVLITVRLPVRIFRDLVVSRFSESEKCISDGGKFHGLVRMVNGPDSS